MMMCYPDDSHRKAGDMVMKISTDDIAEILHIDSSQADDIIAYVYKSFGDEHQTHDQSAYESTYSAMNTYPSEFVGKIFSCIIDNDIDDIMEYIDEHPSYGLGYRFHKTDRSAENCKYLESIGIDDFMPYDPSQGNSLYILNHFNDVAILNGLDADDVTYRVIDSFDKPYALKHMAVYAICTHASDDINVRFLSGMGWDTPVSEVDREFQKTDIIERSAGEMPQSINKWDEPWVSFFYMCLLFYVRNNKWNIDIPNETKKALALFRKTMKNPQYAISVVKDTEKLRHLGIQPYEDESQAIIHHYMSEKESL